MRQLVLMMLLGIFALNQLFAASGGKHPGDRWVKKAINYTHPEYGDIGKAREALDSAFQYEGNKTWPLTYIASGSYHNQLYTQSQVFSDLIQAADDYIKAAELDTADAYTKEMQLQLLTLPNTLINVGATKFEEEQYHEATQAFERVVLIQQLPAYSGDMDTSMVFNTALAAYNGSNNELAIEYFKKAAVLGYEKEQSLNSARLLLLEQGDTLQSIEVLKEMSKAFPSETDYTRELVRIYLAIGQTAEALQFAQLGQQQQPDNEVFYFAEGAVHYNMEKLEKAQQSYAKAIEVNPSFLPAYISLAQVYIDKANLNIESSNNPKIADSDYKKFVDKYKQNFKEALNYLEQADKIQPNDIITLETMREIYYRMEMMDMYKATDAKIKALEEDEE